MITLLVEAEVASSLPGFPRWIIETV